MSDPQQDMEDRIVKRVADLLVAHEEKITRCVLDRIETSAAETRDNSRRLANELIEQNATIKRIVHVFAEDHDGHTAVSARTADKFRELLNGSHEARDE